MDNSAEIDLFGEGFDRYKTLKERLGVWPTTVWPHDHTARAHRELLSLVGDNGSARNHAMGYRANASVFSPSLCSWLLNCYAPLSGVCFDPFAGGGTRAIMTAKHGLRYLGCELRAEEVTAVAARCESAGVDNVEIVCGDARVATSFFNRGIADFGITCPPYFDLERYDGGPSDLSMLPDYGAFVAAMTEVAQQCAAILKPGARFVCVVGLHRDGDGALLPLNHDTARAFCAAGFRLDEEIIIWQQNNGAIQRVGQFEKGSRRLVRTHEYALVFTNQADLATNLATCGRAE